MVTAAAVVTQDPVESAEMAVQAVQQRLPVVTLVTAVQLERPALAARRQAVERPAQQGQRLTAVMVARAVLVPIRPPQV